MQALHNIYIYNFILFFTFQILECQESRLKEGIDSKEVLIRTGHASIPSPSSIPTTMAVLLFFSIVSFFLTAVIGMGEGGAEAGSPSREFFRFNGDVAWVVQVSDLHLSAYHPERGADLLRLLAPALRVIRPSLLLVTGDITGMSIPRFLLVSRFL